MDRVVEERRVHRLPHGVVAAEGEGEVGDAAGGESARAALLDQLDGFDECLAEEIVLFHPRGHGEDVRVEDDVVGPEARLSREQVVGAAADRDLALDRLRLPLLVERHHDDAGAEAADVGRLLEECLLPVLEADRVDDPFALDAAEPRQDDLPT